MYLRLLFAFLFLSVSLSLSLSPFSLLSVVFYPFPHSGPKQAAEPRAPFMDDDNTAEGYRAGMASAATQGDFANGYSQSGSSKANETAASNNVNGPGSGSVRVYQYTVRFADPHLYIAVILSVFFFFSLSPSFSLALILDLDRAHACVLLRVSCFFFK